MPSSAPVVRKFKVENAIDPKEIHIANIMTKALLEQLQLCVATGTPQNIFGQPPTSLSTFCPHLQKRVTEPNKKRIPPKKEGKEEPPKHQVVTRGSIVNTTGKRILFPKGLKQRYCSDFLDTESTCRLGEKCSFVHAIYPSSFPDEDLKLMEEHVNKTEGYSFAAKQPAKKVS